VQGRAALALVVGLAVIAVALALGLFAVADGIRDRGDSDAISVTGSAKRAVSADYVIWDASLQARDSSLPAASSQLERWLERTLALLRASGIRDDELKVGTIYSETVTKKSGEIVYYLSRSLQVRSSRLDVVEDAIEDSTRLFAEGVPLAPGDPQYVYTKLAELRPTLSAEATKDALERAKAILEVTGDELGGVTDVSVAPFQVTAPGSTDVSDYGIYDISTREKEITAVVNVTFAVK
jgi:hypothetical protein